MNNETASAEPTNKELSPDTTRKTPALTPISANKRIDAMDILRGFALIGIILMNIEWFNRPITDLMRFDFNLTGVDWSASWLIKVFVEGKFYKLFNCVV